MKKNLKKKVFVMVSENTVEQSVSDDLDGSEEVVKNEGVSKIIESEEKTSVDAVKEEPNLEPKEDVNSSPKEDAVVDEVVPERAPSPIDSRPIEDMGPKRQDSIQPNKDKLSEVITDESPLAVVQTRNEFYKDGYRVLQKTNRNQTIIILCMVIAFIFVFILSRPQDRFFATTPNGELIRLAPLSEPLLSKEAIISFASEAATQVMTFGFHDYQRRLQESSDNFTKEGWQSFLKALSSANYIETINENRQVISAIPVAPPLIIQEGLSGGVYKWSVEVPLSLSIESGSDIATKTMVVKMIIARRSKVESQRGLGIEQWITGSYKAR